MNNYNNDNIGYLLNKAARGMKWHLNRKLEHYGLTSSQWAVLKDLQLQARFGTKLETTPAAIAERLGIDRPTMSGIVSRLCRNEWVETETNPEDKRSQLIKLTSKARTTLKGVEDISSEIIDTALKGFLIRK